jgi:hypothetical protein
MPPDKKGPPRLRAAGPVNGDHADELIEPTSSKTPAKTQQQTVMKRRSGKLRRRPRLTQRQRRRQALCKIARKRGSS